jgi:protein translocase SecG subunit
LNPVVLIAAAAAKVIPAGAATLAPRGPVPTNVAVPPVAPPAVEPKTFIAQHFAWATHGVAGLFILSAILLIFLLAIQTTKQEGLTGTIGGRVETAYRGRLGTEELLKRWTGIVAVAFVVTGFVLSITGI